MIRTAFVATTNASRSLVRPWDREFALVAVTFVALYVALQWLSNVRPLLALDINPWNPQAGLALAFLVLYGARAIPVSAAAVLIADYAVRGLPANLAIHTAASIWIAIGYGALAAFLRERELAAQIGTVRDAARLAGAAVGGTLLVATGYVSIFLASGKLPLDDTITAITRFWIGDLSGVLTLAPLLVNAPRWREHLPLIERHRWEMLIQLAAILLTLWIIFRLPTADQLRFFYLLFLPVIWIALRWGWPGAMASSARCSASLMATRRNTPARSATTAPSRRAVRLRVTIKNCRSISRAVGICVRAATMRPI
jgi:integral membrane sensor domain MASE1